MSTVRPEGTGLAGPPLGVRARRGPAPPPRGGPGGDTPRAGGTHAPRRGPAGTERPGGRGAAADLARRLHGTHAHKRLLPTPSPHANTKSAAPPHPPPPEFYVPWRQQVVLFNSKLNSVGGCRV
jgi:hypothetical protein